MYMCPIHRHASMTFSILTELKVCHTWKKLILTHHKSEIFKSGHTFVFPKASSSVPQMNRSCQNICGYFPMHYLTYQVLLVHHTKDSHFWRFKIEHHNTTSQKMWSISNIAARTSNLALSLLSSLFPYINSNILMLPSDIFQAFILYFAGLSGM
jgi:hypothetical protein